MASIPYWRLSGFYFFYFATLGAMVPYWGLYLKSLGFGAVEIGQLLAIMMATKVVAPNIWGWLADRHGRHMAIVRLASLLAALAFVGVIFSHTFLWLALGMTVFSFFWNAALPQFEVTTLNHLGPDSHRYSQIRLWGGIGFIVAVTLLGLLVEYADVSMMPVAVAVLMAGIWLVSLSVPEQRVEHPADGPTELLTVIRRPEVLALLVVAFLTQASHGPYYAFYSIYLQERGYSAGQIGQLWALGVIAEVAIFMVMHRLQPRFGLQALLLASLVLTALRWVLIGGFVDRPLILVSAQLLHAASFGVFHATAIALIHRYFPGRLQGRGQALYSSLSFGAGGAFGSLLSGYGWDSLGGEWTYLIGAMVSCLAILVAWKWSAPHQP